MDSPVRWENCHLQVLSYLLMIGTLSESRDFSLSPQSKFSLHVRGWDQSTSFSVLQNFTLPFTPAGHLSGSPLREPAVLIGHSISAPWKHAPRGQQRYCHMQRWTQTFGSPPTTKSFSVISWTQQTSLKTEINVLNGCLKKLIKHNTRRKQQMLFPYCSSCVLPRSFSNFDSHNARHNHPILQWSSKFRGQVTGSWSNSQPRHAAEAWSRLSHSNFSHLCKRA